MARLDGMSMNPEQLRLGVNVVANDDLEAFALELGEAVTRWSADGPPSVALSHAANPEGDGFHYLAVVTGYGDKDAEVTIRRTDEQDGGNR